MWGWVSLNSTKLTSSNTVGLHFLGAVETGQMEELDQEEPYEVQQGQVQTPTAEEE